LLTNSEGYDNSKDGNWASGIPTTLSLEVAGAFCLNGLFCWWFGFVVVVLVGVLSIGIGCLVVRLVSVLLGGVSCRWRT